jgi:hypothetical protein
MQGGGGGEGTQTGKGGQGGGAYILCMLGAVRHQWGYEADMHAVKHSCHSSQVPALC